MITKFFLGLGTKFFLSLATLSLAVVAVMLWRDQPVAVDTLGDVLEWIGGFLTEAVDRLSGFLGSN